MGWLWCLWHVNVALFLMYLMWCILFIVLRFRCTFQFTFIPDHLLVYWIENLFFVSDFEASFVLFFFSSAICHQLWFVLLLSFVRNTLSHTHSTLSVRTQWLYRTCFVANPLKIIKQNNFKWWNILRMPACFLCVAYFFFFFVRSALNVYKQQPLLPIYTY